MGARGKALSLAGVAGHQRHAWYAHCVTMQSRDDACTLCTHVCAGLGNKVDVWWGDALQQMQQAASKLDTNTKQIDFLFLDGLPREYLQYLQAAEPYLAPGAIVVADNAGVFAEGGLKPYLEYVRSSAKYESSTFVPSTLEWRDDVPDGLEVSVFSKQ